MVDKPKDDDAFDDAEFEDLDPIEDEDDLGDDSWDEDDGADLAAKSGAAVEVGEIKKKSFVQKNFMLIVGGVVVVFGGIIGLSLMGGKSTPASTEPENEAVIPAPDSSGVTELSNSAEMPPMPAPINSNEEGATPGNPESAPDALTPMPTPQDLQKTDLAELNVDEVPAAPAGKAVKEGEAPFDFSPGDQDGNGKVNASDQLDAKFKESAVTAPAAPANDAPAMPAPTLTDSSPAPTLEAAPAAPDLTPQLEEQRSQIESLKSQLADKDTETEKAQAALQDSLKEKDQKIAELTKSITNLQDELAAEKSQPAPKATEEHEQAPELLTETPKETPAAPPAKPKPVAEDTATEPPAAAPAKITSWELKGAQPGKAVLSSKTSGDTRTVEVGDTLEGLGKITVIAKDDGHWVVRGTKGQISR